MLTLPLLSLCGTQFESGCVARCVMLVGVEGRVFVFKGTCEAKLGGCWLEGLGSLLTEVPQNKNRRLKVSRLLYNIEV